jgi:hypothetical protein
MRPNLTEVRSASPADNRGGGRHESCCGRWAGRHSRAATRSAGIGTNAVSVAVQGTVTLGRHAPTCAEKLTAVRAAGRVYPVRAVADEIRDPLAGQPRDDSDMPCNRTCPGMKYPDPRGHRMRAGPSRMGEARRRSRVHIPAARGRADHMARRGVVGIRNNIRIVPGVSADQAQAKIEEAFRRDAGVDARHIATRYPVTPRSSTEMPLIA